MILQAFPSDTFVADWMEYVIQAHPKAFGGAIEKYGQEEWQCDAEHDEIDQRDDLACCQGDSNDGYEQFADDEINGDCSSIITWFAFVGEVAYRTALVCFEPAGENFSLATNRAALAKSTA